jgi:hypothetical protein
MKKTIKGLLISFCFILVCAPIFVSSVQTVRAQTAAPKTLLDQQVGIPEIGKSYGQAGNSSDGDSLKIRVLQIIRILLGLLGIITVCLVIFAGFKWMTAGGNEEQIKDAKSMLKNAVIGLAIILMSWSITSYVLKSIMAASGLNYAM